MTSIRNAVLISTGLVLMLIGDAPPQAPLPFQMVSEANAVFGVWRRHARRWAVVGTAVVASSAASAEHSQQSATAQQQSATAQQQSATAQQEAATAQQQSAAAQHTTAPAPAPAASGKPLPLGTVVSTLPHGCTSTPVGGVEYYYCGGNFYRAMFQGNNLVYVTAQPK